MRKLVFALAAALICAAPASAQQSAGNPWANKLFDNKVNHDFGTVAHGAQLKHSFQIKNPYSVPLEITTVRPGCGCVTATPSKKVLQPLEEGSLDIVMDARLFTGTKSVTINVTVGPEYISTAVLRVSAVARKDVVFNPGAVNFGVVGQGQKPEVKVDIEYAGHLNWEIKEVVKPENAPFDVKMVQVYRKPPSGNQPGRVGYRMSVELHPDAPGGVLKHDLLLKTNDPASEVMVVSVDANIQAALRVVPSQVNVGTITLGDTKTFRVQIIGTRPFRITDIKSDGPEITAELPKQSLTSHNLTLRCQAMNLGELKRTITIVTDLEKNASVTVIVMGNAGQ